MVDSPKLKQHQQVVTVTKQKLGTNNNGSKNEQQKTAGMVKQNQNNNNNNNNNNNSSNTKSIGTPKKKRVINMPAIVYSMDAFGNIEITSGSATPKITPKTSDTYSTKSDPSLEKSPKTNNLVIKTSTMDHLVKNTTNLSTSSSPSLSPTSPGEGTFHLVEHISDREEEETEGEPGSSHSKSFQYHSRNANTHPINVDSQQRDKDYSNMELSTTQMIPSKSATITNSTSANSEANHSLAQQQHPQQKQQHQQQQPRQTQDSISSIHKAMRRDKSEVEYEDGYIKRPDNLVVRTINPQSTNIHNPQTLNQSGSKHDVTVEKTHRHNLDKSPQIVPEHDVTVEKSHQKKPQKPAFGQNTTIEKTHQYRLVDNIKVEKTHQHKIQDIKKDEHLNSRGHRPPPVLPKPTKEDIQLMLGRRKSSVELVDDNGDPLYAPITKITKSSHGKPSANNEPSPKLTFSNNNASPTSDNTETFNIQPSPFTEDELAGTASTTVQTQLPNTITTSDLVDENGDALYAPVIKTTTKCTTVTSTSDPTITSTTITKSTTSEISVFSDSGFSSDVSPVDPFIDEPIYATPEHSPTGSTPNK